MLPALRAVLPGRVDLRLLGLGRVRVPPLRAVRRGRRAVRLLRVLRVLLPRPLTAGLSATLSRPLTAGLSTGLPATLSRPLTIGPAIGVSRPLAAGLLRGPGLSRLSGLSGSAGPLAGLPVRLRSVWSTRPAGSVGPLPRLLSGLLRVLPGPLTGLCGPVGLRGLTGVLRRVHSRTIRPPSDNPLRITARNPGKAPPGTTGTVPSAAPRAGTGRDGHGNG
ncbi:hypothetical protein GCM10018953_35960 [Streptosporangium nondiastaticum]|uniref:hypothetical protein n=1 Tax=Streptosporangium nondiastaticum TaxID=35764 RepID=UPI0031F8C9EE